MQDKLSYIMCNIKKGIRLLGITTMIGSTLAMSSCTHHTEHDTLTLLVGSYSNAQDEGIQVFRFDQTQGVATHVRGYAGIANPSFLYPSAHGSRVFVVSELGASDTAKVHVLALDITAGQLTPVSSRPTLGDDPCNVMESPDGKWIYTSNYSGGSITECAVDASGQLGEPREIRFNGSSIDPQRQTRPYLHAVNFTPDGKFLLADDLGTDRIHVFPATAPLDTAQMTDILVPPGTGPRHLTFHPDGKHAYLIGELSGDVVTISCSNGQFGVVQSVRADSLGAGGSADIHCSPDGKYVYASHRLQGDGISILRVNPTDGTLTKVGYQATGTHPRNFILSPNGKYLLVACRDTDEIQIFSRDMESGMLEDTGRTIKMSRPVCLQWAE